MANGRGQTSKGNGRGRGVSRRPEESFRQALDLGQEDGTDSVFSQERMETTPVRPNPPGPPESVMLVRERAKRTVEDWSPEQEQLRNMHPRLNEFDAGYIFEVESRLIRGIDEAVAAVPDQLKKAMANSMQALKVAINGIMNGLSEGIKQERMAKEAMEMRLEDRMEGKSRRWLSWGTRLTH